MIKRRAKIVTVKEQVERIEDRFKTVCGMDWDLSKFPMKKEDSLEFSTDKDKAREFAEVFTPIHIVDQMIQTIPKGGMTSSTRNLDLCSGYGQFSIRMIRKLSKENFFNVDHYLRNNHFFNELQISSCYKLLWIFGSKINLAIGSALELGSLPENSHGIWYHNIDTWMDITEQVKEMFASNIKENQFVEAIKSL